MKFSITDRIIFKLTARRWNRLISIVLCRQNERGQITSAQLHTLTAEFDPTQQAAHRRIKHGQLRERVAR